MGKGIEDALTLAKEQQGAKLQIAFGGKKLATGQHIPKTDTQTIPDITVADVGRGPFLIKCVDLDAPFKSFAFMSPILHWRQHNLRPDSAGRLSAEDTPSSVDYVGAGPPPMAAPHRYLFVLYEMPEGVDHKQLAPPKGQKVGISQRVRYDSDAFVADAKLGKMVAANWFESN